MFEIGSSLRSARIRRGLALPGVEAELKIRARYLDALEGERFEALPGEAYVRGFLRSYADYLGLEGQLYVDEFNSRFAAEEEPPDHERTTRSRLTARPVALLAGGAVVALAVVGLLAWGRSNPSGPPANRAAVLPAPAARHRATRPAVPAPKPVAHTAELVLRATSGRCWLVAFAGSAAGRKIYEGTLEQGQSVRLAGRRLWIRLGAPQALAATLNGSHVALPSQTSSVLVTAGGGVRVLS